MFDVIHLIELAHAVLLSKLFWRMPCVVVQSSLTPYERRMKDMERRKEQMRATYVVQYMMCAWTVCMGHVWGSHGAFL